VSSGVNLLDLSTPVSGAYYESFLSRAAAAPFKGGFNVHAGIAADRCWPYWYTSWVAASILDVARSHSPLVWLKVGSDDVTNCSFEAQAHG
jgi:hypothetical protein